MPKTLIISVGGAPSPVIYSINQHTPDYIIFFASLESKEQIPYILKKIAYTPKGTENIVTESAENINVCLSRLRRELPQKLHLYKSKLQETIVDYTGGTKCMSAALVLSTVDLSSSFSYIGGLERDKGGIGITINGKERGFYTNNPWDELAIEAKKRISLLFNRARYQAAKDVVDKTLEKVANREKPLFEILGILIQGYIYWDGFKYKTALNKLGRGQRDLKIYCANLEENHPCVCLQRDVERNIHFLYQIKSSNNQILDLISNARRRAELENRYDDALIRLYRTLEKRAQIEIRKYKIDPSDVDAHLLPPSIRDEIKKKYFDRRKSKIKAPMYASYQILKEKERELGTQGIGHKFFDHYHFIDKIIALRNQSILIHGENPIDEPKYKDVYKRILQFFEIEEDDIPLFPVFEL